jgi:hypothetical protein
MSLELAEVDIGAGAKVNTDDVTKVHIARYGRAAMPGFDNIIRGGKDASSKPTRISRGSSIATWSSVSLSRSP